MLAEQRIIVDKQMIQECVTSHVQSNHCTDAYSIRALPLAAAVLGRSQNNHKSNLKNSKNSNNQNSQRVALSWHVMLSTANGSFHSLGSFITWLFVLFKLLFYSCKLVDSMTIISQVSGTYKN